MLANNLPWKQYRRRRGANSSVSRDVTVCQDDSEPWTLSDKRHDKLLDSGLSGGITGGILNTLKRA
jgi:hypothetical protein